MARGLARLFFFGAILGGCGNGPGSVAPAGSSSPAAPVGALPEAPPRASAEPRKTAHGTWVAIPVEPETVERTNNPKGEERYAGPTGTLKGTVRLKGDPPPDTEGDIPKNCTDAVGMYGKWFRVGPNRAAPDVAIVVTGYDGYVPAREPVVKTTIHGCAIAQRTLVVTFGQRIDVQNTDKVESYRPYLLGAEIHADMVAVPGGQPVKLYATYPSHYMIRDELGPLAYADVFVLQYGTIGVTDLEGHYEIRGIPVGSVNVAAFLPSVDAVTAQPFVIKEGDSTLDLTLTFDKTNKYPGPTNRPRPVPRYEPGSPR